MNQTEKISQKIIKDFRENVYSWLESKLDITINDAHISKVDKKYYHAEIVIKGDVLYLDSTIPKYIMYVKQSSNGIVLKVVYNIDRKY